MAFTAVLLASGCGAPPKIPPLEPRAAPVPMAPPAGPAAGDVLGRNDRFVIYVPRADESLRQIAARFLGAEDQAWQIAEFNGITRPVTGQPVVVPLEPINTIGVQVDQIQTVPILAYHRFNGNNADGTSPRSAAGYAGKMIMSSANFAAQLDWLARNDYHVIRLSKLVGYLDGKQPLPKRSVVITVDDGYESFHRHALPVLRKYGFPATLFVYTDFVGAGDALSWAQLREIDASGLVDIQAHSKTHRNLIDRAAGESDAAYRRTIELEAQVPRELLERRLGKRVRLYAYPYGDANETVLDVLQRQQYQLAVTVNPGGNAFFAQPLMLRRTMIYGDYDLEAFKSKLQTHRAIGNP